MKFLKNFLSKFSALGLIALVFSITSCINTQVGQETDIVYALPERIDKQTIKDRFSDLPFDSKKEIKIAMLLPLTGKHKAQGVDLYRAAQLALFDHGDPRIVIYPFDTKGSEFEAIEIMKKLVQKDIQIIIGPLFGHITKTIAPIATQHGITIISFTNNTEVASENIYSLGINLQQQVDRVASYASSNGINYFTALLPGNKYGSQIVKELRDSTAKNQGVVLKSEFYQSKKGFRSNSNRITRTLLEVPVDKEGKPLFAKVKEGEEIPLDENGNPEFKDIKEYKTALLLSDNSSKLSKIASYIDTPDFKSANTQLIGLSTWDNNSAMNKPVFEGGWYSDIPKENFLIFTDHFYEIFGKTPNKVSALGYDIVSVISALAAYSDSDIGRDFKLEGINNPSGFSGITGVFRLNQNGTVGRLLEIYEIKNGQGITLDPAPFQFRKLIE